MIQHLLQSQQSQQPKKSTTAFVGHQQTDDHNSADLSYLHQFRIQGQGFRLPQVHFSSGTANNNHNNNNHNRNNQEQQHIIQQQQQELLQKQLNQQTTFEGYRKHMPQVSQ